MRTMNVVKLSSVKRSGAFETTDGMLWRAASDAGKHQLFLNLKLVRDELGLRISDEDLNTLAQHRHKLQASLDVARVA